MGPAFPTPRTSTFFSSTTTTTAATSGAAGAATVELPVGQPPAIYEQAASPPPPSTSGTVSRPTGTAVETDWYRLPKNKSTGNLLAHASRSVNYPDSGRQRFSFDASAFESMSK